MEDENQLKSEVKELERQIKAWEKEKGALEVSLREELRPEFEEVIRYARKRGHAWLKRRLLFPAGADNSDDDWLIGFFVELAAANAVARFRNEHLAPLTDQLRDKRKELRELKERREALNTPPVWVNQRKGRRFSK